MQTFQIPSQDAVLHARLEGPANAPVITLLHTLATTMALYDEQARDLAASYRVLRLDMRGHGQSTAGPNTSTGQTDPETAYTLAALAQDVITVWDHLGIKTSHLLGLSIGGMIALEVALTHPSRVTSLIAADCRADVPPPFLALWPARRALLAEHGLSAVADATLPTWFTPSALPEAIAEARAMILETSPAGYYGATRALEGVNITPRLPSLKTPTLFLAGSNDGVFPQAAHAMAEASPNSRAHIIQGPAHLPNLEAPAAFAAAITPFLKANA